jgi:small GTP-binding protein
MRGNILLIGEAYVGKTTIASAMMKIEFTTECRPTVGTSVVTIPCKPPMMPVRWFSVWDTAGMKKSRSLTPVYYRDSTAALVVYNLANRQSFAKLPDWLKLDRDSCGDANPVVVVGNKLGLERVVTHDEALAFAQMMQCEYVGVSAKTGAAIDDILPKLAVLLEHTDSVSAVPRASKGMGGCCG